MRIDLPANPKVAALVKTFAAEPRWWCNAIWALGAAVGEYGPKVVIDKLQHAANAIEDGEVDLAARILSRLLGH